MTIEEQLEVRLAVCEYQFQALNAHIHFMFAIINSV
jgi:hypothetical protein